jgi:hypothetical protein
LAWFQSGVGAFKLFGLTFGLLDMDRSNLHYSSRKGCAWRPLRGHLIGGQVRCFDQSR